MSNLYIGLEFANGWIIEKKYNCAESKELGLGGKNSHWLAVNKRCGISYIFENTVLKRWVDLKLSCVKKCEDCKYDKQKFCYFSKQNNKTIVKKIERNATEITLGKQYGDFVIIDNKTLSSTDFVDRNCRVLCKCINCNEVQLIRFDTLREKTCQCQNKI